MILEAASHLGFWILCAAFLGIIMTIAVDL